MLKRSLIKWDRSETPSWLAPGDIPADPLVDLETTDNKLSVFYIDDEGHNLKRVVVALAANRQKLEHAHYALFDQRLISEINITVRESSGNTPDDLANSWHRNLVELSAQKIVALAKAIYEQGRVDQILSKEIGRSIKEGMESGQIDPNRMPEKLRVAIK